MYRKKQGYASGNYQVGGSLDVNSPVYVVREADRNLYKMIKEKQYCNILNPRQMGKSSLRVRTTAVLSDEGIKCITIDFTGLVGSQKTLEQWYQSLIYEICKVVKNKLDITLRDFELKSWWNELDFLSSNEKLREFIETILLKNIPGEIVFFFEEIDSILNLNYSFDSLFGLFRYFYDSRADNPDFKRITFVLIGAVSPYDLISDSKSTLYNIGEQIILKPFKLENIKVFEKGLKEKHSNPSVLLEQVYKWTQGQPFLTQKICREIERSSDSLEVGQEAEWIANLVNNEIIEYWYHKDDPPHFRTIEKYILGYKLLDAINLYQDLLEGKAIKTDHSKTQKELYISGLIKEEEGFLKITNPIYQKVFNLEWVEDILEELLDD